MSKIYDLSEYLSAEPSKIKLGDDMFPVSDGFNDLLKLDALMVRRGGMGDMDFFQEFLKISLGEVGALKIAGMNLRMPAYRKIMDSIQDIYGMGEDAKEDDRQSN